MPGDDTRRHWENVFATKAVDQVSWYRPHLETSLALIRRASIDPSIGIIDAGGGASTLVDDLLAQGYQKITVLDVSQAAIDRAQKRLKELAPRVCWITAEVTQADLPPAAFDVWHDRALFHFLTSGEQRRAYVERVLHALKPSGHLIIGGFGPQGPSKCSGLDVMRYDAASLSRELGAQFRLAESLHESHQTPFRTAQEFIYCRFRIA